MKLIFAAIKPFYMVLIALMFGLVLEGRSQVYYHFQITCQTSSNMDQDFFIFLNVGLDGTASARVKYINASETFLVEQNFVDSSAVDQNEEQSVQIRYLNIKGEPYFVVGSPNSNFPFFRVKFLETRDSLGVYYEPQGFEYQIIGNEWKSAITKNKQIKTAEELVKEKDFVEIFYQKNEASYTSLTNFETRGAKLNRQELKTTFYLIAVANTLDPEIGEAAQKDLDNITVFFSDLTTHLGIKYVVKKISDGDFSIQNIEKTVKSTRTKKQDILLFYYSGHGFRYEQDISQFPRMSIKTNRLQLLKKNNLQAEDIYNQLLRKKSRLTMLISDCCNARSDAPYPFGRNILRPRAPGTDRRKLNYDNCRNLFFPSSTTNIIIGSAKKNQLAAANRTIGSFFTNFFHTELVKSLYGKTGAVTWRELISNADESTRRQALTAQCGSSSNDRCIQKTEWIFDN